MLDENYLYDYMVSQFSDNILQEEQVWDMPLYNLYKRSLLTRFNFMLNESDDGK